MKQLVEAHERDTQERLSELPRLLFVPVRVTEDWISIRTFRTPGGESTAVAFTSEAGLVAVLGEGQASTRLCERALRDAMSQRGVERLTVDPTLYATAVSPVASPAGRWDIRHVNAAPPVDLAPVPAETAAA